MSQGVLQARSARLVLGLFAAASLLAVAAAPALAGKGSALTVSPNPVEFPVSVPSDPTVQYAMVTITNEKGAPQTIVSATPTAGDFWVTWGGTCNDAAHKLTIKSHQSCTLEYGYHASYSNGESTQAYVYFASGALVTFSLWGPPAL